MKNQIDLMKNSSHVLKRDNHYLLHWLSVGLLFFVSFSAITLFILIALSPLPSLLERESDQVKKLSVYSDSIVKLDLTKKRIGFARQILSERSKYHESIAVIAEILPAGSEITGVEVDEKKALLLTVSATSLMPHELLTESLLRINNEEKVFKKITLESGSYDNDDNNYLLKLKLIRNE
jgi:hypothetical protein